MTALQAASSPAERRPQPPPAAPAEAAADWRKALRISNPWVHTAALGVCAALILGLRLHCLDLPLDSDEGEYGHTAQRLLAGDRLYMDVFDNKPPAIHFTYALGLWLLGDSDHSIRWVAILFSWAALGTVYACARQLFGGGVALWAAFLYCWLNVEPRSHAHIAKIELFATPFLLGALALALRHRAERRLLWLALAAVCVGIAASYKPWFAGHAALLLVLAWSGAPSEERTWRRRWARCGLVVGMTALPCLLWMTWLMASSDLRMVWDSLVTFNAHMVRVERTHANQVAHWMGQLLGLPTGDAFRGLLLPLWWAGIACAVILAVRRDTAQTPGWRWLGLWAVVMLLEVTAGARVSNYYFSPLLPMVTMAVIGVARLATAQWRVGWQGLNALLALLLVIHIWRGYLRFDISQMLEAMWRFNTYLAFREVGLELREIVPANERIYMWGFDTINFYSQRRSASRYFWLSPTGFDPYRAGDLVMEVMRNRPMVIYENRSFPGMPVQLDEFVKREYVRVSELELFRIHVLKEKHALWQAGAGRLVARMAEGKWP
jgi:4-amino-4-deoxy-L-arabinose transferase-like glycosyltransferase